MPFFTPDKPPQEKKNKQNFISEYFSSNHHSRYPYHCTPDIHKELLSSPWNTQTMKTNPKYISVTVVQDLIWQNLTMRMQLMVYKMVTFSRQKNEL